MFADVTSANIVGYNHQDSVKGKESTSGTTYYKAPGMGVSFFPISGDTQFNLLDTKVVGMDPDGMWFRVLSPADSKTTARYTYVEEAFIRDYFGEEYLSYVGWWDKDIADANDGVSFMIMCEDDSAMIKEPVMFPVGTALLAKFDGNTNVKFLSDGEVPTEPTKFIFGKNKAPYFKNYLPVETKLADVKVAALDSKGEIDPDNSMDPDGEWIRVLSSDDTRTIARYTYVDPVFISAYFGDEYLRFAGWWDKDIADANDGVSFMIMCEDDSAMIKDADKIQFPIAIGKFAGTYDGAFLFPSALDLPSAK